MRRHRDHILEVNNPVAVDILRAAVARTEVAEDEPLPSCGALHAPAARQVEIGKFAHMSPAPLRRNDRPRQSCQREDRVNSLSRTGVRQARRNDGRDLPEISTSHAFEAHGPFGRYFEYIVSLTVGG